jgi:hypothetical protein
MTRRMAREEYRKEQWDRRFAPHICEINEYVESLACERGEVPYVAPLYGGVNARLLTILRDPGPMTQIGKGSGFICMENDDPTAEALCKYYQDAQIPAQHIVPWNAYPWYINKKPSIAQLRAGAETISHLIKILPKLQVVMLHGNEAHKVWTFLSEDILQHIAMHEIKIIETYHTSRLAFIHKDPQEVSRRKKQVVEAFSAAAKTLYG